MLLAYHAGAIARLRTPSPEDPWRVLLSGCLAAWPCGVDATDNGVGGALRDLLALPTFLGLPFCPEQHSLGTPRTMPDIEGGDGVDVLAGRARVVDEHGADLTLAMTEGARAMLDFARARRVELAILTDMSAACGSQVISLGSRRVAERRYQKGVGVATALLLEAGLPVVSQRDFHTLALLRARLDPRFEPPGELRDHHEHPWTAEHLPEAHSRARARREEESG
jgi:uncharacterized protein YbbK (DUF523 family)